MEKRIEKQFSRNMKGKTGMNDHILHAAINEHGTPLYLFDIELLNKRVNDIKNVLGQDVGLCYAMKANPFLVGEMAGNVDRIEVCSPGELEICMSKQIPPEKLLISGVSKEKKDILLAMSYGVRSFTVESIRQMLLLDEISNEKNISINIYCRLNAGSQFGMSKEDFDYIVKSKDNYRYCNIVGLHYFVGTQRRGSKQLRDVEVMQEYLLHLNTDYSFTVSEIEYGPGLYYPYFTNEPSSDFHQLSDTAKALSALSNYKITIEMGRYFAASCGYYMTKVVDVKYNKNVNIAILDGGIHHLNYYGSNMGMKVPFFTLIKNDDEKKENLENWFVCGSLCTTSDVMIRSVDLYDLREGDIFVFGNVGAYSVTEGLSLFLSRELPCVIKYENGRLIPIRDRFKTAVINNDTSLSEKANFIGGKSI